MLQQGVLCDIKGEVEPLGSGDMLYYRPWAKQNYHEPSDSTITVKTSVCGNLREACGNNFTSGGDKSAAVSDGPFGIGEVEFFRSPDRDEVSGRRGGVRPLGDDGGEFAEGACCEEEAEESALHEMPFGHFFTAW